MHSFSSGIFYSRKRIDRCIAGPLLFLCVLLYLLVSTVSASAPSSTGEPLYPKDTEASAPSNLPAEENDFVSDYAGLLKDDTKQVIIEDNKCLERKAGVKIVVATVEASGGRDIETYANTLFQKWKLDGDSVLILAATDLDTWTIVPGASLRHALPWTARTKILNTARKAMSVKTGLSDEAVLSAFRRTEVLVCKAVGVSFRHKPALVQAEYDMAVQLAVDAAMHLGALAVLVIAATWAAMKIAWSMTAEERRRRR